MADTHAHVASVIDDLDPGAMVTQFVLVAEVIDTDGHRGIWVDTHDGATRWDTLGLLKWALNEETGHQYARIRDEDDEDDE